MIADGFKQTSQHQQFIGGPRRLARLFPLPVFIERAFGGCAIALLLPVVEQARGVLYVGRVGCRAGAGLFKIRSQSVVLAQQGEIAF